jgi:sec-independent protein translocase protein TatA
MPWGLTPAHLIIILVIVLIVVGPGKLPDTGAAIGKALRGFKDQMEGTEPNPTTVPPQPGAPVAPAAPAQVVQVAQPGVQYVQVPAQPGVQYVQVPAQPAVQYVDAQGQPVQVVQVAPPPVAGEQPKS